MIEGVKNVAYSLFFIFLCLLLGKLVTFYIGGLPGSLYGMIFFNFMLYYKIVSAKRIEQTISWAISNMGVCFVPAGVGIINHFDLLAQHGIAIVSIIFITTFILITFIGVAVENKIKKNQANNTL